MRHRTEHAAFATALVTGAMLGFDRIDPSVGLTQDLRMTDLRAAALLTLVLWLLACCVDHRLPRVPRGVGLALMLWLASLLVSSLVAPTYRTQALAFTRDLVLGALVGWVAYDLARSRARQLLLIQAVVTGGIVVVLVGLGEAASLPPVLEWVTGFRYVPGFSIGEIPRVGATLPHPNAAAMFLGLTLPLQFAWAVTARRPWTRMIGFVGVSLELIMLILTLSRAGILVAEMVLGMMLIFGWRWRDRRLSGSSLCAAVGLPALVGLAVLFQPLLLLHLTREGIEGWYAANYAAPKSTTARAGEATLVPVRLVNTGARTWYASGEHRFALSYHLLNTDGTPLTYDGARTLLPHDVSPGAAVDLQAELVAPPIPGAYLLEWDVVQESITWFSWNGNPPESADLNVAAPAPANPVPTFAPTAPPDASLPPAPDRLVQWRIALRVARNRPLLGVGPDNFRWVYGDFAGLSHWDTGNHANSIYFEWLADTGVVGLALFLWLTVRLLRVCFAGLRDAPAERGSGSWRIWRLALAASLVAWFLHGLVDYFYEPLPTNLAFWLLAAIALAASRQDSVACV